MLAQQAILNPSLNQLIQNQMQFQSNNQVSPNLTAAT
jgi:hypothetical protein